MASPQCQPYLRKLRLYSCLLRAKSCQRTRRPQVMTQQSPTRCRVQQQEDGENHLISWRFLLSPAEETANRFWRHNDLIQVKDRPRISWARLYKQQSRREKGKPAALPFPLRAIFERRSEGHRWVFGTGGNKLGGSFVPAELA